jgi:predicted ribosome quality control (RQC) complex YloA/Tae2 family protein
LRKVEGERVLDLHFGTERLHLRLTGRGGGLWLLRGGEIIAAYDGPAPEALPELPALAPRPLPPRFEPEGDESWDLAARRWFGEMEARNRLELRRTRLRRKLQRLIDRDQRLMEALEGDLLNATQAPRLRAQADTLAAHLHEIPRGAQQAIFPDLEYPDQEHRIPLDPASPPSATMERLYKRARRLERVGDRILDQLVEAEERLGRLRTAIAEVEDADAEALPALESLVPRTPTRTSDRESEPWDRWTGPDGSVVLVGRNARSNRILTFQKARGRDFWMHIRERPGAHVVIPLREGKTPPRELLLAAAQIVLAKSKVLDGDAAEVQYTRVKNVKSIPGDPGGKVIVHEEKVLHVRRDAAALVGWRKN